MVGPPVIDDIMMRQVAYVDINDTVSTAIEKMEKKGVREGVVVSNDRPVHGLSIFTAYSYYEEGKVSNIPKEEMSHVQVVRSGTPREEGYYLLEKYEFLVIVDQNEKIIGYLTRSQFLK